MALLMVSVIGNAFGLSYWQDNRTRQRAAQNRNASVASRKQTAATTKKAATAAGKPGITAQPILADEDTIPDSLLHTRWPVQRTQPISTGDLYQSPLDLQRPDNMKYHVEYNDTLDRYVIGNKLGGAWLSAPIMMTPNLLPMT